MRRIYIYAPDGRPMKFISYSYGKPLRVGPLTTIPENKRARKVETEQYAPGDQPECILVFVDIPDTPSQKAVECLEEESTPAGLDAPR